MVVLPAFFASITPFDDIVATDVSSLSHIIGFLSYSLGTSLASILYWSPI